MNINKTVDIAEDWFNSKNWDPFPFQKEAWRNYLNGNSGIVNAPTGSGKTYSLFLGILMEFINYKEAGAPIKGLQAIWITPIKALSKEIELSARRAAEALAPDFTIAVRTGDTTAAERTKIRKNPPHLLITTPESLQLMLTYKDYPKIFKDLKSIIVDEWHELIGSKRGVQMELAITRLKGVTDKLKIWGISATIGNMEEAMLGLHGVEEENLKLIRSAHEKQVEIESIFPDELESLPWAGHLGIKLLDKIIPIIESSSSTLIFTNTRSFAEVWYQKILERAPELAGVIAMHHGSISRELRDWVEDALHEGKLKAVVCTSSLDLGVDFRPVETIIQVGSPKGVARFLQRAGRSGHQPGALSKIYFCPTHSLELLEAAALRKAQKEKIVESRLPYLRSFDVLIQYLVTLSLGEGFKPEIIFREIIKTLSYESISREEWEWILNFITRGGAALTAYDEYQKVIVEDGIFKIKNKHLAMKHRLSIGTIVSDASLQIKYVSGKYIGTVEEWFISRLNPGDVFWFGGRNLELVRIKGMEVQVRNSKRKAGPVPSWQGGRMPLSSEMSKVIRFKIDEYIRKGAQDPEVKFITPMLQLQQKRSVLPDKDHFLIEYFKTREGYHVMMYPFEGRFVHEGLAALIAYRMSRLEPITFSIAMNDYGFELLSDKPIPIYEAVETDILSEENLSLDIQASINSTEMARRKFRDIASIAGLIFKGYPGKQIKDRHVQSSSQLFFQVFNEYEPDNLLLQQAYEEVMDFQLEEVRLRNTLKRINKQQIIIKEPQKPTPLGFPIMVDRMREKLSSETLEDRVRKMQLQYDE
ncbi:MAG: ligase-associated DNA damage response DEXH box helicase [Candidatus Cyclobacteriaceae bacterium M2_1C_046]